MDADAVKYIAIVVLFALAMLGGLAPLWVQRRKWEHQDVFMSLANMFSAGIFLGGALMHLLPESAEMLAHVNEDADVGRTTFMNAFFLCLCGYIAIQSLEEAVVWWSQAVAAKSVASSEDASSQDDAAGLPSRTLSRSIVESLKPSVTLQTSADGGARRASGGGSDNTGNAAAASGHEDLSVGLLHNEASSQAHAHSHSHGHSHGGNGAEKGNSHGHAHGNAADSHADHSAGHGGHGHAHFTVDTSGGSMTPYVLVLALTFHAVFEGVALGTQQELEGAVSIFIVIAAHTPLEGFALGISLIKARANLRMMVTCLLIYAVTAPVGTILGLIISRSLQGHTLMGISGAFQGFAAGTFLFVAFGEIIPKELAVAGHKAWKMGLLSLGVLAISLLKLASGEHSHDH